MLLTARKSTAPTSRLEPPDSHYVKAAQGWLELANPQAALEELNQVSPQGRAHPLFLFLRWELYAAWRDWPIAHLLGQYLVELCPQEPLAWLQRSYSLYALKRTAEAFEQLLPAAQQFEGSSTVAYHLACYASQLGFLQEAWHWLDQAIARGEADTVKSMALEDPLLAPLWENLGECLSPAPREA